MTLFQFWKRISTTEFKEIGDILICSASQYKPYACTSPHDAVSWVVSEPPLFSLFIFFCHCFVSLWLWRAVCSKSSCDNVSTLPIASSPLQFDRKLNLFYISHAAFHGLHTDEYLHWRCAFLWLLVYRFSSPCSKLDAAVGWRYFNAGVSFSFFNCISFLENDLLRQCKPQHCVLWAFRLRYRKSAGKCVGAFISYQHYVIAFWSDSILQASRSNDGYDALSFLGLYWPATAAIYADISMMPNFWDIVRAVSLLQHLLIFLPIFPGSFSLLPEAVTQARCGNVPLDIDATWPWPFRQTWFDRQQQALAANRIDKFGVGLSFSEKFDHWFDGFDMKQALHFWRQLRDDFEKSFGSSGRRQRGWRKRHAFLNW